MLLSHQNDHVMVNVDLIAWIRVQLPPLENGNNKPTSKRKRKITIRINRNKNRNSKQTNSTTHGARGGTTKGSEASSQSRIGDEET